MAKDRPQWLADLSRSFKRHQGGRAGWFVEVMRDQFRVVSAELPPRSDAPPDAAPKRRAITLGIPPGPATAGAGPMSSVSEMLSYAGIHWDKV
ncbi:MAG: hypothetical protein ACK40D_11470 [Cyanobacteriota bacterium]